MAISTSFFPPSILAAEPDVYETATRTAFNPNIPLPIIYSWETESKIIRIVKQILCIIIFPLAIRQILHAIMGKFLVLASTPILQRMPRNHADRCRASIPISAAADEFRYGRIRITVNGRVVDAVIVGRPTTLRNGRWFLNANGTCGTWERTLSPYSIDFRPLLDSLHSNAILFNYPGVAASAGLPDREAMANAYRALLTFLESRVGATEIIAYGHSLGGNVQADALAQHPLREGVRYVSVQSRTFGNLSDTVYRLVYKKIRAFLPIPGIRNVVAAVLAAVISFFVRISGWNMNAAASAKNLRMPAIILQTAAVTEPTVLNSRASIRDDGIIDARVSLAGALLDDPSCPRENRVFLGIPQMHNTPLTSTLPALRERIDSALAV